MIGSLLIITQTVMLGSLVNVYKTNNFITISFIAQTLGGLGAGANSTASMAIMSSFSKSERERFLGWIQAANGLGLLTGPLLGALLYQLGGYMCPFIFFGKYFQFDHNNVFLFSSASLYLIAYPFLTYNLMTANNEVASSPANTQSVRLQMHQT